MARCAVPSRLAVIVSARPSWAKLQPVCEALEADGQDFDLIACAYALSHNRGGCLDMMRQDGWEPTVQVHAAIDASTLETSVLTTGFLTAQLGALFHAKQYVGVVVCADRHETIAASIAATFQNVKLLHLQGGERSGGIDDRVRFANTALADFHAVCNAQAYQRVIDAGAKRNHVEITGCPSIDVARKAKDAEPVTRDELDTYGTGLSVDPQQPFTILMHHPSTEHPELASTEWIDAYALARGKSERPMVIFWPGADAGSDESSKVIRGSDLSRDARLIRSLPPRRFLKLLSQCTLAVGNSSALIREGSYLGVPRIITGHRQAGRDWTQEASTLYGDGKAAPRIAAMCRKMVGQ